MNIADFPPAEGLAGMVLRLDKAQEGNTPKLKTVS
jgi:hypothetical protein